MKSVHLLIKNPKFVIISFILSGLILILFLELCTRIYFVNEKKSDFFITAKTFVYQWYPKLRKLENYTDKKDQYDVLMLGGSVLVGDWGTVTKQLKHQLEPVVNKKVNIINMAASGHTTLDSLYKYRVAEKKRFDLVVIYHGINEVRANNVPPEYWKDDYSHYSWYRELGFYFRFPFLQKMGLILPYRLNRFWVRYHKDKLVHLHDPRPEWLEYGAKIKTARTFRKNLEQIIQIADQKQEPLLVMTFAYAPQLVNMYRERHYTMWGIPDNVVKGIDAHNDAILDLSKHHHFLFVDQKKRIKPTRINFRDICHFTDVGAQRFAKNIVEEVKIKRLH